MPLMFLFDDFIMTSQLHECLLYLRAQPGPVEFQAATIFCTFQLKKEYAIWKKYNL